MSRIKPTPSSASSTGYYVKTDWQTGDVITRPKMMNIEDWLASANDELIYARTGYTTNNREDWIKYQYGTIGERIDDIVDYLRKLDAYTDISRFIHYVDEYWNEVKDRVNSSADDAIVEIQGYDSEVAQAKDDAIDDITDLVNDVENAKNTAINTTIPGYVNDVNSSKNAAISTIGGYEDDVEAAKNAAINNINGYDTATSNAASTAQSHISGYDSATSTAATTAQNNISDYDDDVLDAANAAKATIQKYISNESPAAGEVDGVRQVADDAIETIDSIVGEVIEHGSIGGADFSSSFTIAVSNWAGSGPFTYSRTYSSLDEDSEYNPTFNIDEQSYSYLLSSITASSNTSGTITFSTSKKPVGPINIQLVLQKVEDAS